jgi:hypothetical protein
MKIQINTQVTETKTIEVTPGYYRGNLLKETVYYLSPGGTLVYISKVLSFITTPDTSSYEKDIQELATRYTPCDKSEFDAVKDKYLCHLAHYVSFPEMSTSVKPALKEGVTNTMFDPNQQAAGQQEATEQATEQTNAQESASQDQAMEVAEEGGVEG